MVGFVVLHFNNINSTIKCVDSIISNTLNELVHVVIVDNASPDGSGIELLNNYLNNNRISVILNSENYGFSRGNNIGCTYLKTRFNPEFICVFNNDTYINDNNFINKIKQSYIKTKFHALGPKIWNTRRFYNQNPYKVISNIDEIDNIINEVEKKLYLLKFNLPLLFYMYSNFFQKKTKLFSDGLYGAAIIFSKKYFELFEKTFPEITFMYGEENFLFYRKIKYNLIFEYDFNITVYHNHSNSTRKISRFIIDKWKFQYKEILKALLNLKNIYCNSLDI